MKNIAGIFYDRTEANRAVADLLNRGFLKDDISLLMSEEARKRHFHDVDHSEELAKGGMLGATFGGVLGALVAGLTAVGSLSIPGIGLLAAGPIVAALAGAGAGAAVGGLSGALIAAGFSASEAKYFEDQIRKGNVVLIVRTDNENEMLTAHDVLRQHEAVTETV